MEHGQTRRNIENAAAEVHSCGKRHRCILHSLAFFCGQNGMFSFSLPQKNKQNKQYTKYTKLQLPSATSQSISKFSAGTEGVAIPEWQGKKQHQTCLSKIHRFDPGKYGETKLYIYIYLHIYIIIYVYIHINRYLVVIPNYLLWGSPAFTPNPFFSRVQT